MTEPTDNREEFVKWAAQHITATECDEALEMVRSDEFGVILEDLKAMGPELRGVLLKMLVSEAEERKSE